MTIEGLKNVSVAITLASAFVISVGLQIDPLVSLPTTGLLTINGYPAETHSVITEDGYILELHRIPYSPKSPPAPYKPPVLLIHGILSSSADWIYVGTENGFGYILADLGYDVWLGNSRGNTYSKKHVSLNPNDTTGPFWDFSWHEMGMYDVPADIDYILETTGQPNLFYVGYSQGTTQFYVMASERPEYNDKIRAMFSFAPVAYMSHIQNAIRKVIVSQNDVHKVEEQVGARAILQHSKFFELLGQVSCSVGAPTQILCENLLYFIFGYDREQMNTAILPIVFGHTPAGSSTKQFNHFAQSLVTGKFRRYDYGRQGNLDRYGVETPPDYDLGKITAPVYLHYASNDYLSSMEDVDQLYEELGNPFGKFLVPHPKFNHLDFILAIDVKTLLFDQVTDLMANHYNEVEIWSEF